MPVPFFFSSLFGGILRAERLRPVRRDAVDGERLGASAAGGATGQKPGCCSELKPLLFGVAQTAAISVDSDASSACSCNWINRHVTVIELGMVDIETGRLETLPVETLDVFRASSQ